MQLLTGRDETGQFPLSLIREAGSSLTEPGATPKERLELIYEKWSDVQDACGTSRLYGGMHFSKQEAEYVHHCYEHQLGHVGRSLRQALPE